MEECPVSLVRRFQCPPREGAGRVLTRFSPVLTESIDAVDAAAAAAAAAASPATRRDEQPSFDAWILIVFARVWRWHQLILQSMGMPLQMLSDMANLVSK